MLGAKNLNFIEKLGEPNLLSLNMKLIEKLPDYSNDLTRSTESKMGPYIFKENNYPNLT